MFKYYLIHNLEEYRKKHMFMLFDKYEVDINNLKIIDHPNKDELTYKMKKELVFKNPQHNIRDGWISCSYKHYLAIEDIVNNNYPYGVIMEDNIGDFFEKVPIRLNKYLNELPLDWGVVFDSSWLDYKILGEQKVSNSKLTYLKSHNITRNNEGKVICWGATRAAQFYFLNLEAAKKMKELFIPFNHSADMWMNEVLRKGNINTYWSEPSLVTSKLNTVTSTLFYNEKYFYRLKSKIINNILRLNH